MYRIYANIGGILMVNVTIYAYMDPMGMGDVLRLPWDSIKNMFEMIKTT